MKTRLLLFALLVVSTASFAQKQHFGIVGFSVAPGFESIKNDNVLTYYKEDKSTGAYCNFFIYKIMPGRGDVRQDFDASWNQLLQKPFKVTGTATLQPAAVLNGWQFLIGTAKYSDNGISTLAMLITFSAQNNMQNIAILANSDEYKAEIEAFLASVDVVKEEVKNIHYDVWMCDCYTASGTTGEKKFKTVVLSPEGRSLYYMPEKGLNGVTPENSNESGSWGTVSDQGKMLSLVNSRYGKMELYKLTPTSMNRYPTGTSSIYKKVQPVDGLRIEGAYSPELSYYNGKDDILSRQTDPQKRPILFFRKDGTYVNEGIAFSNLTLGDDYAIGRGTYEIVNYSLILTTQSGRKLQVAFAPILDSDPRSDNNGGLLINNVLFYRLGKNFVPHG